MDYHQNNNLLRNKQQQQLTTALPKNLMLTRGFSRVHANQEILNETRAQIETNLGNNNNNNSTNKQQQQSIKQQSLSSRKSLLNNNELTCYSFMLPNLNKFNSDYKLKEYLQNELIEVPAQFNLTESGHLNWWTQQQWENVCRPLYPMVTSGDGNCLLHAASLAMWGLHDRYLILRKALHSTLKDIKDDNTSALWRRWKWEQMCQNRKYGLIYDDDEWSKEWQSLLKLSSYQPRVNLNNNNSTQDKTISNNVNSNNNNNNNNNKTNGNGAQQDNTCYFESLEEFHVFLLAHILKRPIIIVSDTMLHDLNGEPLSPIPFGGIYLPFECDINKCHRYPLVLAYDSAHFSALVLMDDDDDDEENDNNSDELEDDDDDEIDEVEDDNNDDEYEDNFENQIDNNDETHDLASFYPNQSRKQNILTYEQINHLNKKLQLKPPYSVIPLTYSNKTELLPVHFSHDPGADYDWSLFPNKSSSSNILPKSTSATSSINSNDNNNNNNINKKSKNGANNTQNQENNHHQLPATQQQQPIPELTRNDKIFLIQKYLDIVKLELFDPGPLGKRNGANQAFNSSGMCATICNVYVPEPIESIQKLNGINTTTPNNNSNYNKQTNIKSQNKLQKFFNLFKRNNNKQEHENNNSGSSSLFNGGKLRKSIKNLSDFTKKTAQITSSDVISPNRIDLPILINNQTASKTLPIKLVRSPVYSTTTTTTTSLPNNNTNNNILNPAKNLYFHKLITYKNWNYLFDSMAHHACLLGVKLNLAKLPKFKKIIYNYIESTKHKLELIKQQQKAQILQQQIIMQQRNNNIISNNNNNRSRHVCHANRHDCNIDNLCNYCNNSIHESIAAQQNKNNNQYNNNNNNGKSRRDYQYNNKNEKIYEDEITSFHHI